MERYYDSSIIYKLEDGYQIIKICGESCSLVLKDKNAAAVAVIDVEENRMTMLCPYQNRVLTDAEKKLLHKFIINNRYRINNDVAASLGLSIFREGGGEEEYLSERQLLKKLRGRLKDVYLFVGQLKLHTLRIPAFSKGGIYNLSRASVKKLIVEKNCDLLLDLRDNMSIEALRVHESFTGSINMSRNTVESIVIGNNCRCDLAVYDSLRCFNLMIADVYSGNLNIKNSCFHALEVGFYCYAVIKLANNWGRRFVKIGDSFRGSLNMDHVNIRQVKIGNDCKGKISVCAHQEDLMPQQLRIGEEFAGVLDLRDASNIRSLQLGRHARGRLNLLGCPGVRSVEFDKYFCGYADFSESTIEYVNARYGCSGEMIFLKCPRLALLKLPKDRRSDITIERAPLEVQDDNHNLYYRFSADPLPTDYLAPLYLRFFHGLKSMISGEPN